MCYPTFKMGNVKRRTLYYCSGKTIIVTYYECVFVALVIQHAFRVLHIVICDLSGPKLFLYILSQRTRFSKKKLLNSKCVFQVSLQLSAATFLIIKRTERNTIYNAYWYPYKVFLILVRF
jgi:hypothetical protein